MVPPPDVPLPPPSLLPVPEVADPALVAPEPEAAALPSAPAHAARQITGGLQPVPERQVHEGYRQC